MRTCAVLSFVSILIPFNLFCACSAHTGFWKALITCDIASVSVKLGTGSILLEQSASQ